MSSKKIYTSIGIAEEVLARLDLEARAERRSRSFIVEKALRERYKLPWAGGIKAIKETVDAD